MKHEFCDYEIATELSGFGFCRKTFGRYHVKIKEATDGFANDRVSFAFIKAPLWQQAIDFFLERFGIWIEVNTTLIHFYDKDEKLLPTKFQFILDDLKDVDEEYIYHSADDNLFYESYKEARRAGILKAIEVVKLKRIKL